MQSARVHSPIQIEAISGLSPRSNFTHPKTHFLDLAYNSLSAISDAFKYFFRPRARAGGIVMSVGGGRRRKTRQEVGGEAETLNFINRFCFPVFFAALSTPKRRIGMMKCKFLGPLHHSRVLAVPVD